MSLNIRLFIILMVFLLIGGIKSHAAEIILKGTYLGKNVFVRNPLVKGSNNYCVTNIFVNGRELTNLPRSSAIQIDLTGYSYNSSIEIRVLHKEGCYPVFINPDVITNNRGFEYLFTQIDDNSINWITTGETPGGYYELEKMKWKGWQAIDSIPGKGQIDNNQYSLEADHYAGDNQYRLIFHSGNSSVYQSDEINFYSLLRPVTFYPKDKVIDLISLSRPTDYEIYDEYGILVLQGYGEYIDVDHLDYLEFTIIIENEPSQFYKPEPEIIRKPRRKKKNSAN